MHKLKCRKAFGSPNITNGQLFIGPGLDRRDI